MTRKGYYEKAGAQGPVFRRYLVDLDEWAAERASRRPPAAGRRGRRAHRRTPNG